MFRELAWARAVVNPELRNAHEGRISLCSLPVPAAALLLGTVASIVLAIVARNHVDLAGASRVGLPAKTRSGRAPRVAGEGRGALNRFTLLLVAATAVLLCAAVTFPR